MYTSVTHIIIGIQYTGDVLCKVTIKHSLDVVPMVNYMYYV